MMLRHLLTGVTGAVIAWSSALAQPLQGFDAGANVPPAFAVTSFYDASPKLARAKPGDILKAEPVAAPSGARAWRVMYASRTWDDQPVAATGLIIASTAKTTRPRPVLVWAHGTTGGARGCAPSLAPDPARSFLERGGAAGYPIDIGTPYLTDLMARGYVVAAPDYQGLGGPGVHQFLVGDTAARGGLDAARAARHLRGAKAGADVVVLGWSQGGQAALTAGEVASAYAPDLRVRGVAALAPSATIMSPVVNQLFRSGTPHVYEIIRGYASAYGLSTDLLSQRGRDLVEVAGQGCILEVFKEVGRSKEPGVIADVTNDPAWTTALERNNSGLRVSAAPVLVVHGSADGIVPFGSTDLYQARACAVGTKLQIDRIEGGDHRSIIPSAREGILHWMEMRLRGEPAKTSCPSAG
ncbi:MAG: alpha/beta fold hydrolase [Pseudomonadota bacterium]|uniref:alpha/beta fold hydrolase n=1 Tax=Phenylobacterium sp. TaxID=1871053 RepID=UPI0025FA155B|nr:alpha/beta fold hydrolase [Phenylobacterium sp.]MBT9473374.1 alpha/beta fold hydrolase [Phenylobacterium sp.]